MTATFSVSPDQRRLLRDGAPWIPLGDTAWELFHRLDLAEAEHYLDTRARQGFNLILVCALAEENGLRIPDRQGHLPFAELDPARPVPAYWAFVDAVIERTNRRGMVVGLLPTWGDKWHEAYGAGPVIFRDPAVARGYGAWIGRRYRDRDILWVLGGDRALDTDAQAGVIDAMADGIRSEVGGRHLMTFHPKGDASSGDFVHARPWLDLNLCQSGHAGWDKPNYELIERDHARTPIKPCLDGEPRYEHHPVMLPDWSGRVPGIRFTDYDVRTALWHAWTAGACGHVYGCHAVWQFHDPARYGDGVNDPGIHWRDALLLPGAERDLRVWLALAHEFADGVPDQSLLAVYRGVCRWRVGCLRAPDRSWALCYLAAPRLLRIDGSRLSPPVLELAWIDPRSGARHPIGAYPREALPGCQPPSSGKDWLLHARGA
jgi:hypothetical protein